MLHLLFNDFIACVIVAVRKTSFGSRVLHFRWFMSSTLLILHYASWMVFSLYIFFLILICHENFSIVKARYYRNIRRCWNRGGLIRSDNIINDFTLKLDWLNIIINQRSQSHIFEMPTLVKEIFVRELLTLDLFQIPILIRPAEIHSRGIRIWDMMSLEMSCTFLKRIRRIDLLHICNLLIMKFRL